MAGPPTGGERRARPDPVPMRLAMGVGAIAVVSVVAAGLARPGASSTVSGDVAAEPWPEPTVAAPPAGIEVPRLVRYVRLRPGQTAPPGARVIREAAPTPRVVIVLRAAPPAPRTTSSSSSSRTPRRTVTRTRQSGG